MFHRIGIPVVGRQQFQLDRIPILRQVDLHGRAYMEPGVVVSLLMEGITIIRRISADSPLPRLFVDFAGPFYTFTLETVQASLGEYEQKLPRLIGDADYPSWFGRVTEVMKGGAREFHATVD